MTSICFSSSGWAVSYYLGIAAFIQDNYNMDKVTFLSCSGGILPSLLLCLDINIRSVYTKLKPLAELCNSNYLGPSMYTNKLIDFLLEIFPDNLCDLINNRLKLSVTEIPWFTNKLIDDWNNIDELKSAIICSCYSPMFFPNIKPKYKNNYYIDGGFSNNHPIIDSNTIVISAFFEKDIINQDKLTLLSRVYYPGDTNKLDQIFNLGYKNAYKSDFIFKERLTLKNNIKLENITEENDVYDDYIIIN